jgi:hypothetical protein
MVGVTGALSLHGRTFKGFPRPAGVRGVRAGDSCACKRAMLDLLPHHGHVLKCGPRSWRTKTDLPPQEAAE